jgi:hypothetical protein
VTLFVVVAASGGCSSSSLPPDLTGLQKAQVGSARISSTLGVAAYQYPIYSNDLMEDLRATAIFDRVDRLDSIPEAPLIAVVTKPVHGQATIPVMTLVSLGFIPTETEEDYGYQFVIRSSKPTQPEVRVDCVFTTRTTVGWWAVILNFSRERAGGDPSKSDRFRKNLAAAIAAKHKEISALTRSL